MSGNTTYKKRMLFRFLKTNMYREGEGGLIWARVTCSQSNIDILQLQYYGVLVGGGGGGGEGSQEMHNVHFTKYQQYTDGP